MNEEHITAGSSSTTPTQYRRVKVVVDRKDDGVARANFYDPPTSLAYGMAGRSVDWLGCLGEGEREGGVGMLFVLSVLGI